LNKRRGRGALTCQISDRKEGLLPVRTVFAPPISRLASYRNQRAMRAAKGNPSAARQTYFCGAGLVEFVELLPDEPVVLPEPDLEELSPFIASKMDMP
jgi:hypothetical protein